MKQWFRGTLEGLYVGQEGRGPVRARATGAQTHHLKVYRAEIYDAELLDVPDEGAEPPHEAADAELPFAQASIDDVRLHVRTGLPRSLVGAVHDVRIRAPQLLDPARHGGRIYGCLTGEVTGWFVPPAEPERPEAIALAASSLPVATPPVLPPRELEADPARVGTVTAEGGAQVGGPHGARAAAEPLRDAPEELGEPMLDAELDVPRALPRMKLPIVTLSLLVGLALFVKAEPLQVGLWALFMVPTLVVRRFLLGVLEDSTPMRAIATALVCAQLAFTAWELVNLRTAGCGELAIVPLIGLVAGVFLSGLLPFATPLLLNATGFALVLFAWSAHDARVCERPPVQQVEGNSTVTGPGIPRTNPDGSWPRRP